MCEGGLQPGVLSVHMCKDCLSSCGKSSWSQLPVYGSEVGTAEAQLGKLPPWPQRMCLLYQTMLLHVKGFYKKKVNQVLSTILWVSGKEVLVREDSSKTIMGQHQCTLCRMAHCVWENLQGLEMEEGDLAFMQIVPCTSFLQKEV